MVVRALLACEPVERKKEADTKQTICARPEYGYLYCELQAFRKWRNIVVENTSRFQDLLDIDAVQYSS